MGQPDHHSPVTLDLICLANSHKYQCRCLAGLRADGGGWVRPVSAHGHGELQYKEYRLPDYTEPRILDVIRVGVGEPSPLPYQPENRQIDGRPWQLIERPASVRHASVLAASLSRGPLLLGDRGRAAVEADCRLRPRAESLALVRPRGVRWRTEFSTYELRNKPRVMFHLGDADYDLPVTDPAYAGPLQRRDEGEYTSAQLGIPPDCTILFTISLSEPYAGICYKLLAAVVLLPPEWRELLEQP